MTHSFSELEEDFLRITTETVFCTATTVDAAGRPRNRILHPIFVVRDGEPVGWALTGRTPLKVSHLATNPHMACAYWTPSHDTVFVDCMTNWVEDDEEPGLHPAPARALAGTGHARGPVPPRRPHRTGVAPGSELTRGSAFSLNRARCLALVTAVVRVSRS